MIVTAQYSERINLFLSTNENGNAYDSLKTKEHRDSYVMNKLIDDWVDTMEYNPNPLWDCSQFSHQLQVNFYGDTTNSWFSGYNGFDLDSILYNRGTLKDNGKYGLPVLNVLVFHESGSAHEMNAILTGNNALDWNDWNFMEPQIDQINVQPGQAFMPGIFAGTDTVNGTIYIRCPFYGPLGIKFEIINGKPELSYDENMEQGLPHPLIITQRDTLKPQIYISSPSEGVVYESNPEFEYSFIDSTLKDVWYSLDSGNTKNVLYQDLYDRTIIGQEYCDYCTPPYWHSVYGFVPNDNPFGNKILDLKDGHYQLIVYARDYFNNESYDTINFSVNRPTSIENITIADIKVYPNPVSDVLSFEYLSHKEKTTLIIYDMFGRQVKKAAFMNGRIDIDFTNYNSGIYFYQLMNSRDEIISGKIIKE